MPVLQLNPKKTALVLIDLQNATVGVNTAPYSAVQVVANSKKLAEGLDAEEHRFAFKKIFPRLARIRATDEVIAALV